MRRCADKIPELGSVTKQTARISQVIGRTFRPDVAKGSGIQTVLPFTGLDMCDNNIEASVGGVAVDAAGNVYVADSCHNQVVKLAAGSSTQTVLPFRGLRFPEGVAVDGAGNVYVVDHGDGRIMKLPAGAHTQTLLPTSGLGAAPDGDVVVDAAGNVYAGFSKSHYRGQSDKYVLKLAPGSDAWTRLPSAPDNSGKGLSSGEQDLAVDTAGNLYAFTGLAGGLLKLTPGSDTWIELRGTPRSSTHWAWRWIPAATACTSRITSVPGRPEAASRGRTMTLTVWCSSCRRADGVLLGQGRVEQVADAVPFPEVQQVGHHLQRRTQAFVVPDPRIGAACGRGGAESLVYQRRHVQQPGDAHDRRIEQSMAAQAAGIESRPAAMLHFRDEQRYQFAEMPVPQVGFGARHGSPQGHAHVQLSDASPVQQAAAQDAAGIAPKPRVVDVGVPVAQGDVIGVGGQLAHHRVLVAYDPRHVFA